MKKITFLLLTAFAFSWQARAQFTESFETEIPVTWTIINNGSSNGWEQYGSPTGGAQDGTSVARIVYDSSIAHDDYLITPGITVTAGVNDRLSYYIKSRSSSFLEPYEVLLSTSGTNQGDFTEVLQASSEAPASWTLNEFDLSAYAGQTVYVAIHATGTNEWELYVDNVVNDTPPTDTLDYYNVQWPPNGTISAGESYVVYAQCWEGGLTDASSSPAVGVEAWIGYSSADTDPSTAGWTWVAASPNPGYDFNASNDEYQLDLGANISATGTFYYASRWRLNGGPYTYGGINGGGNGDWATYGSGVLTVNPAANDLPSGAITLTLDEGTSCGANTITGISNVGTSDSGEGDPSCSDQWSPSAGNGDLWYSFAAPSSELTLNVTNISGLTSVSGVLYSGTPGSFVEVGTCGNAWPKSYTGLTQSETYYLRLWDYGNDQIGTFDLCGYYLTCTSATVSYSVVDDCDVSGGFYIDVDVTDLGSASSLDVDDDQGSSTQQANTTTTLTFGPYVNGTDVVLTITPNDNVACSLTSSTLTQAACPPANDDCSNAIMLTPGVVYGDYAVDGTVLGATSDAETNGCGLNGPGVWYSVVVPNDGNITIETGSDAGTGNTAFDSVIEAFSGSCGSLVSIECDDDDADTGNFSLLELTGLVPGETIYLRVWEYNGDETEPFSISAYSGTLSSGNSNSESLFSYYPNPVNNSLTLNAQKTIENVSVVNMLGQEVMNVSPNSINDELDMSNLSNGSYFVRVTVEGIMETIRIVKQ